MLTEKARDRSYFNLRIRLALLLLAIVHSRILDILLRSGIFILKSQECQWIVDAVKFSRSSDTMSLSLGVSIKR